MKNHFNIVGDIRGIGLFYGVELVRDRNSKEKAISEAERVMYKCMEKGLSFMVSQGNVLTLAPPLMDIVAQSIKEIIAQV